MASKRKSLKSIRARQKPNLIRNSTEVRWDTFRSTLFSNSIPSSGEADRTRAISSIVPPPRSLESEQERGSDVLRETLLPFSLSSFLLRSCSEFCRNRSRSCSLLPSRLSGVIFECYHRAWPKYRDRLIHSTFDP